ncbi:type II toxin-antitoxin system CcdA family antitoxin [Zhengella sp. ZM62]|uniref:type II toxin-antitoxin system CcdA family antitoxin n=1 Tax=Zhengella sedimenti TaxID=3390035 RepID=UPI003976541B
MRHERPSRKTAANLSINAHLAEEARALGINLSEMDERGIADAVKAEKERRWKEENAEAIRQHNAWVEENGLPLEEYRMF